MRSSLCTLSAGVMVGLTILSAMGCNRGESLRDEPVASQVYRPRYGALMSEVGRRFELLGRAAVARRWELAAFELHELEEVFEELRTAELPHQKGDADLRGLEEAFINTYPPELKAALSARDSAVFTEAFGNAAATCNGCHKASAHGFIEVPAEPGAAVPRLDPVP